MYKVDSDRGRDLALTSVSTHMYMCGHTNTYVPSICDGDVFCINVSLIS